MEIEEFRPPYFEHPYVLPTLMTRDSELVIATLQPCPTTSAEPRKCWVHLPTMPARPARHPQSPPPPLRSPREHCHSHGNHHENYDRRKIKQIIHYYTYPNIAS